MLPDRQIVYVPDYRNYVPVAEHFGMLDGGKPKPYVSIEKVEYMNPNGIVMPAVNLVGHTVNLYVVNDSVHGPVTYASELAKLINYFPNPEYHFGQFVYAGKFTFSEKYTLYDHSGRGISIDEGSVRDLNGIHDLMTHLALNHGDLLRPVLMRYVYAVRQMRGHKMKPIGYFNLRTYLRAFENENRLMFNLCYGSKSNIHMRIPPGTDMTVRITGARDVNAVIDITGMEHILDVKKANAFEPYVILSLSPLKISTMKFPWQTTEFDGTKLFLTPMMTGPAAWNSLKGGIDLLDYTKMY